MTHEVRLISLVVRAVVAGRVRVYLCQKALLGLREIFSRVNRETLYDVMEEQ